MFNLLKRLLFPNTYNSRAYIKYLQKKHVLIGNNSIIYSPNKVIIDVQRPHMLSIGDYVKISSGVVILAHDYSRGVFCNLSGYQNIGECKKTTIGDNCFIGTNAIILMGANIGANCIIGAGAVVPSKDFPPNSVICGNPAKVVCTLDEYYKKLEKSRLDNAKLYAIQFYNHFRRRPSIDEMTNAFFWLYLPHTKANVEKYSSFFDLGGVNRETLIQNYLSTEPLYDSFESFLDDCCI